VELSKEALRKEFRSLRDNIQPHQKEEWDNGLQDRLRDHTAVQRAHVIFCYVGFGSEPDTLPFIEAGIQQGKRVGVPSILSQENGMRAAHLQHIGDLQPSKYGIPTPPEGASSIQPDQIDLVIVPGLAFDEKGYRIGYGGGFYDRFLQQVREDCTLLALAYPFQVIPHVPQESFDIPVHEVLLPNT